MGEKAEEKMKVHDRTAGLTISEGVDGLDFGLVEVPVVDEEAFSVVDILSVSPCSHKQR